LFKFSFSPPPRRCMPRLNTSLPPFSSGFQTNNVYDVIPRSIFFFHSTPSEFTVTSTGFFDPFSRFSPLYPWPASPNFHRRLRRVFVFFRSRLSRSVMQENRLRRFLGRRAPFHRPWNGSLPSLSFRAFLFFRPTPVSTNNHRSLPAFSPFVFPDAFGFDLVLFPSRLKTGP